VYEATLLAHSLFSGAHCALRVWVTAVSTYSWSLVNVFSSVHTVEPLSKDTPELRMPSHNQDRTCDSQDM